MANEIYQGDTIRQPFDISRIITGWKIRAELYDKCSHSIKLANTLAGGSNDEILVTSATSGTFTVIVAKGLTTDFSEESYLEVEVEDTDSNLYTVYKGLVEIHEQKITWTTK